MSVLALPGLLLVLDALPSPTTVGVGLSVGLLLVLSVPVAALIDVLRLPRPAMPPRWTRVLLPLAGFLAISTVAAMAMDTQETLRERYVQAFRIPSGSMIPTLLVGDHFLVNRFVYRFTDPARGDVVVFQYPVDESRDFVMRAIAVGGEDLYIADQKIYVNCKPTEASCRPIDDPWGRWDRPMSGSETTSLRVPLNSYFVMGDNRNNSRDSRYWGFVRRDRIKGRALLVYWSWDRDRQSLWERVRWSRLGKLIY